MHWCWVKIMVCTFYLNGVVKVARLDFLGLIPSNFEH